MSSRILPWKTKGASSASLPPAWHATLRTALSQRTDAPIAVNSTLISESLHDYQKKAIYFALARGGRVLLGHEMGLGKTPMAIAVAAHSVHACLTRVDQQSKGYYISMRSRS